MEMAGEKLQGENVALALVLSCLINSPSFVVPCVYHKSSYYRNNHICYAANVNIVFLFKHFDDIESRNRSDTTKLCLSLKTTTIVSKPEYCDI